MIKQTYQVKFDHNYPGVSFGWKLLGSRVFVHALAIKFKSKFPLLWPRPRVAAALRHCIFVARNCNTLTVFLWIFGFTIEIGKRKHRDRSRSTSRRKRSRERLSSERKDSIHFWIIFFWCFESMSCIKIWLNAFRNCSRAHQLGFFEANYFNSFTFFQINSNFESRIASKLIITASQHFAVWVESAKIWLL